MIIINRTSWGWAVPSSVKLKVMVFNLAAEVVINFGVQLLFRVGGGGSIDCGRIKQN